MSDLQNTIHQLGHAFEAFKDENNKRLRNLESKNSVDVILDEKIRRIEHSLDALEYKHLQDARPQLTSVSEKRQLVPESKAFLQYLRLGDEQGLHREIKALSRGTNEDGGYLVPDNLGDMVRVATEGLSTLRKVGNVITVATDHVDLLIDRHDFGSGWVAETAARDETNTAQLQKQKINVHEMYAKPRATQKLLDDAYIDVENWISDKIAQRFAKLENESFIQGDGNLKPTGFLRYTQQGGAPWAWGQLETVRTGRDGLLAENEPQDQLLQLVYALKPQYHDKAVWIMSRSALQSIRRLKDEDGRYIWQPSLQEKQPSVLFGYPVYMDDQMPALGGGSASTPMAFGNFYQGYQIVDRAGLRILRDPYSAKPFIEFYATKRVGGDVVNFEAIKILSCQA